MAPIPPIACRAHNRRGSTARAAVYCICWPRGASGVLGAPDLARHFQGQAELTALVVDRDLVAVVRAREAALRAQAEVLERHVLGGGLDAALEIVLGLERRHLGADQAEHDLLSLGHEPERLEAARAVRIVLNEQPLPAHPPDDRLGGGIVAA